MAQALSDWKHGAWADVLSYFPGDIGLPALPAPAPARTAREAALEAVQRVKAMSEPQHDYDLFASGWKSACDHISTALRALAAPDAVPPASTIGGEDA